ncbi:MULTISPECIES: YybS family protein [unclassified Peribacillus]|uniref:YybS family protein n=1 Tax=unclassified Peribacillus TaxID=2675266 RepID=UPI0019114E39|nr:MULTISPECIES: YybS family protein [unclassified Peribacillus]MBK5444255.1 YybS family protein [Peribacillus sp. TH24]MBK5461040.1 YybS family protein [Peribacillus sp. TH27]MBK5485640.1 YybS family protein [Peribacillus sp. TH16]MBK5499182.1 YybS family protein [Peribacillus sp. TH14]WMX55731.1 YybS family protein [Peribacillus sp. R9-11]
MNSGRRIAEGGALLALYCILLFITVHIPIVGTFTLFFLPIPFILVTTKQKISWALGYLFVASLLSILISTILSVPMTLLMGATGITIGYFLKKDKPMAPMFISTVLVFLGGTLLIYAATVLVLDVNYIEKSMVMLEESIDSSVGIMESFDQAPTERIEKRMHESIDLLNTLMPSLFVVTSVIMVLLIFFAAHPILKRFSDKTLKWPHFRDLRLPKSLLWYYLITMLLALFVNTDKNSFVYMAITNLFFILQFFILIQGYSLVFYISHVKSWTKAILILIVVASLLHPIFITIIRFLGIIDLGFPFRETIKKKE